MGSWRLLLYLLVPTWTGAHPAGALGVGPHAKGTDGPEKPLQHQLRHGSCTYTFLLPAVGGCESPPPAPQVSNSLQVDAPSQAEAAWPTTRLQQLESATENNSRWLQKLEGFLKENGRMGAANSHLAAVQSHTVAMLEISTTLLNHTAEQTRKLSEAEVQVLSQISRLEIQTRENNLSTSKLEKQLLLQAQEISVLQERNSFLEKKVLAMEGKREEELQGLGFEKAEMQQLLSKQTELVGQLEQRLQRQLSSQAEAMTHLMDLVSHCSHMFLTLQEEKAFKDCADAYKAGFTASGVYTLHLPNATATAKVFCDMETSGGGWTVIQQRKDGSVDFQRTWEEYKQGFGFPPGEYWLGNDLIHLLTSQASYSLRINLQDWEGNKVFALYEHFQVGPEEENYRLYAQKYSGTAGRMSSLGPSGTEFSTKDVDNDHCACKCAQVAGGGWWFDACGPSNLNGIFYTPSPATVRYNGMKWHYWKGPSHSLKMTTMMIRPGDFREE